MQEPIAPLTGADSEWNIDSSGSFQNNRLSSVFKDAKNSNYILYTPFSYFTFFTLKNEYKLNMYLLFSFKVGIWLFNNDSSSKLIWISNKVLSAKLTAFIFSLSAVIKIGK